MTNKNNKTEEKQKEEKGGKKFLKLFLLFTLLFVFGIYLLIQTRPDLTDDIYPNKITNTKSDEGLVNEALKDNYSVGPEPPIHPAEIEKESVVNSVSEDFSKHLEMHPTNDKELSNDSIDLDEVVEIANPYSDIVDKEAKAFNSSAMKSKFNDYRIFISNANKLIEKYKSDENFTTELKIFKEHIHPMYINETIKLLSQYNEMLEKKSLDNRAEITPDSFQTKLIKKFVKIKKIEPVDNKIIKLKSDIDEKLEVFTNYIYSQNLQDSLVK